jgi:hypothetical protein
MDLENLENDIFFATCLTQTLTKCYKEILKDF